MILHLYFGMAEYLENVVRGGEVLFNPLSYFMVCEDQVRREYLEDSSVARPVDCLRDTITADLLVMESASIS